MVAGLYDFVSDEEVGANLLMASVVVTIPIIILFTLVRRYLIEVQTGGPDGGAMTSEYRRLWARVDAMNGAAVAVTCGPTL